MHGTHRATRQEYAIKVLDKGHLKRNNKLNTALAEKNTLVRLGSGHPGIVRLHWAFQDDWSLCESVSSAFTSLCREGDCHPTTVGYYEIGSGQLCRLGFIPPFASSIRHDAVLSDMSGTVTLPTLPLPLPRRAV
jgi:serine/threonine protein kinase